VSSKEVDMPAEDRFSAAQVSLAFFNAYVNNVSDEIGSERAMALYARTAEQAGEMQGRMARKEAGDQDLEVHAAYSILRAIPDSMGILGEVLEESPSLVQVRVPRCSIYESYLMAGLDEAAMQARCRHGSMRFMDTEAKQLNPRLTYQLTKFRASSDDACFEELRLE
jgi:hypothetical protein